MEENKVFTEDARVVEYNQIESTLATLKSEYGDRVYDVTSFAGLTDAKKARATVKKYRTSLEGKRRELKAPLLAHSKLLDSEAKRITIELLAIENPIDEIIKEEEARKAEAKRIAIEAEEKRVAKIIDMISHITSTPSRHFRSDSKELARVIETFEDYSPKVDDGFFAEFTQQAKVAMEKAHDELQGMLVEALEAEAEAARLEVEKAAQEAEAKKLATERAKLEAERRNLAQAQADAAEAKALTEDAKQPEVLDVPEDEQESVNFLYSSQSKALEAIYAICVNSIGNEEVAIEKIGSIAAVNMGGL